MYHVIQDDAAQHLVPNAPKITRRRTGCDRYTSIHFHARSRFA